MHDSSHEAEEEGLRDLARKRKQSEEELRRLYEEHTLAYLDDEIWF